MSVSPLGGKGEIPTKTSNPGVSSPALDSGGTGVENGKPAQGPSASELLHAATVLTSEMLSVLKAIATQLECPSRNTTMTSYRRDGSVIISTDIRQRVRDVIAKADPATIHSTAKESPQ